MCMAFALSFRGVTLAATDTRRNYYGRGGGVRREDPGGKLVPLADGAWAVGSGDALLVDATLAALDGAQSDRDTVQRIVMVVAAEATPAIRARFPGAEPEATTFLIAAPDGAFAVRADGAVTEGSYLATWPPEMGAEAIAGVRVALEKDLAASRTPDAITTAVQSAFAKASEMADTMSSEFDAGLTTNNGQRKRIEP